MSTSRLSAWRIDNQGVSEEYTPLGPDETVDLERPYSDRLLDKMQIKVVESTPEELTFDLSGVDSSIANALRRIMLAEVATVAIEHVYIEMNTSILHDEVLAHRLGLVPINVDPSMFDFRAEGEGATSRNTLVFSLEVECVLPEPGSPDYPPPGEKYTMSVYSSALQWCPQGDQADALGSKGGDSAADGQGPGVRPVHPDILLAKLRPGQRIKLEAHCEKGVGKDHAKFSPVATASYRLLPRVAFRRGPGTVTGADAVALEALCPMKVFDVEDLGGGGGPVAVAARPRDCSVCRECIRLEGWSEKVRLARAPDHFIFKVEAVGMMSPRDIVKESIRILRSKCEDFVAILDGSAEHDEAGEGAAEGEVEDDDEDDDDDVAEMLGS